MIHHAASPPPLSTAPLCDLQEVTLPLTLPLTLTLTLTPLQEVTAQISERTGHLPGVAIAIMGCIVNGPGEMADADFGYVGGAPGKVDLYVGKEVVKRSIPNEEARASRQ